MNMPYGESLLNQFPPSSQNNSRSIVRKKLEKMNSHPSDSRRQELEGMVDNISIDHSDEDYKDMDVITKEI